VRSLLATLLICCTASFSDADQLEERAHQARESIVQVKHTLQGRWFGFTSHVSAPGEPRPDSEAYGVVYYSDCCLYANFITRSARKRPERVVKAHIEAIVSDNMLVSVDHRAPERKLSFGSTQSTDVRRLIYDIRLAADVKFHFERKVERFVDTGFSIPSLDEAGRLTITSSNQASVDRPGTGRTAAHRAFKVLFDTGPPMRPSLLRLLLTDTSGAIEELGSVQFQYTITEDNQPLLSEIKSSGRMQTNGASDRTEVIRIRELREPWSDTDPSPQITVFKESLVLHNLETGDMLSADSELLPPEVNLWLRPLAAEDRQRSFDSQVSQLESIQDYVGAGQTAVAGTSTLAAPESSSAGLKAQLTVLIAGGFTIVVMIGCFAFWIRRRKS
jgi:hypothetical protein